MLRAALYGALGGLSIAALDNMADRTAAGFIGLAVICLALVVIVKAAR